MPRLRSITDTSYFPTDELEHVPEEPAGADTSGANKDLAFLGCVPSLLLPAHSAHPRPAGTPSSGSPSRPPRSDPARDKHGTNTGAHRDTRPPRHHAHPAARHRIANTSTSTLCFPVLLQQQQYRLRNTTPHLSRLSRALWFVPCLSRPNHSSVRSAAGLRHVNTLDSRRSNTAIHIPPHRAFCRTARLSRAMQRRATHRGRFRACNHTLHSELAWHGASSSASCPQRAQTPQSNGANGRTCLSSLPVLYPRHGQRCAMHPGASVHYQRAPCVRCPACSRESAHATLRHAV